MSNPSADAVPLPERMTWDELNALPDEQAARIELVKGRPVWVRTGPPEHQRFATRVRNALEVCARESMRERLGDCWQVDTETNVFLSPAKDDFLTPDFMLYHCPDEPWTPIFAPDVLIVGEVLSPSNHIRQMLAKQARYADMRHQRVLGSDPGPRGPSNRHGPDLRVVHTRRPPRRCDPAASPAVCAGR